MQLKATLGTETQFRKIVLQQSLKLERSDSRENKHWKYFCTCLWTQTCVTITKYFSQKAEGKSYRSFLFKYDYYFLFSKFFIYIYSQAGVTVGADMMQK